MSKKHPHASSSLEPSETDDLKLINGIGPAVENRLHGVGIFTFAQLAALSPADIAASVADLSGLSAERIIKQDWIAQARELATETTLAGPEWIDQVHKLASQSTSTEMQKEAEASMGHLHKATFTVELLLDEDNAVNNTHIVHMQSGDKKSWTDWKEAELIGFLVQHAELKLPLAEPTMALESVKTAPAAPLTEKIEPVAPEVMETTSAAPIPSVPRVSTETRPASPTIAPAKPMPSPTAEVRLASPVEAKPGFGGVLRIHEMEIVTANDCGPHSFLRPGEPFKVQLTLDLSDVPVPSNASLAYKASIYGESLGGQKRQTVSEAHSTTMPTEKITVNVQNMTLPHGLYRLRAVVSLALATKYPAQHPDLIAGIGGGLVQVY